MKFHCIIQINISQIYYLLKILYVYKVFVVDLLTTDHTKKQLVLVPSDSKDFSVGFPTVCAQHKKIHIQWMGLK